VLPAHLQCKLVLQSADRGTLGRVQSELRLRLLARFAPRACRSRDSSFSVDLSIAACSKVRAGRCDRFQTRPCLRFDRGTLLYYEIHRAAEARVRGAPPVTAGMASRICGACARFACTAMRAEVEDIRALMDRPEDDASSVLKRRLAELNAEVEALARPSKGHP